MLISFTGNLGITTFIADGNVSTAKMGAIQSLFEKRNESMTCDYISEEVKKAKSILEILNSIVGFLEAVNNFPPAHNPEALFTKVFLLIVVILQVFVYISYVLTTFNLLLLIFILSATCQYILK